MGSDETKHGDKKAPMSIPAPEPALPTADSGDTTKAAPLVTSHVSGTLEGESLQANLSAIATAQVGSLEAVGSAVGFANVSGDATVTASATPVVYAKGNVSVRQSYASAVLAGGDMEISQAGAPLIIGKRLNVSQGGAVAMAAGEAEVTNGFVGILITPKATIAEESRVLIGTKAALIIAAALLGGFGLVALVMVLGVRRVMTWRPQISVPQLPSLAEVQERIAQIRSRRAA